MRRRRSHERQLSLLPRRPRAAKRGGSAGSPAEVALVHWRYMFISQSHELREAEARHDRKTSKRLRRLVQEAREKCAELKKTVDFEKTEQGRAEAAARAWQEIGH
jgi:hypothetical protein